MGTQADDRVFRYVIAPTEWHWAPDMTSLSAEYWSESRDDNSWETAKAAAFATSCGYEPSGDDSFVSTETGDADAASVKRPCPSCLSALNRAVLADLDLEQMAKDLLFSTAVDLSDPEWLVTLIRQPRNEHQPMQTIQGVAAKAAITRYCVGVLVGTKYLDPKQGSHILRMIGDDAQQIASGIIPASRTRFE